MPHPVTANLESALRHLRETDFARIMWVDALCIDQKNIVERATRLDRCERFALWPIESLVGLGKRKMRNVLLITMKDLKGFSTVTAHTGETYLERKRWPKLQSIELGMICLTSVVGGGARGLYRRYVMTILFYSLSGRYASILKTYVQCGSS
jgi:hypothetical protein